MIAYIKRNYCYDKDTFSLYEPIEVPNDAVFVKGYKENIVEIRASDNKTVLFKHSLFAKSFTPNDKNILLSEYIKKPKIVEAITDHMFIGRQVMLHRRCEVLTEKRGSFTMLKCLDCGQESPLALNSFILTSGIKDERYFNCK